MRVEGMYLLGGEGATAAVDGMHVVLTIDEVIQYMAERSCSASSGNTTRRGSMWCRSQ